MNKIQSQIKSSKNLPEKLFRLHEAMADFYCELACYSPAVKHYKLQVCHENSPLKDDLKLAQNSVSYFAFNLKAIVDM